MRDSPDRSKRTEASELGQCACFSVRKAARAVTHLYDEALRPSGLRATQFSLLTVIGRFGRLSITGLAEAAVMDRTTLTRNLRVLEREGLIRIEAGEDARVREMTLTPAAHEKLAAARSYWSKAQAHMVDTLGAGRVKRLLADLSATIRAARTAEPGARAGVIPNAGRQR